MNMVKMDELAKSELRRESRLSTLAPIMRYDTRVTEANFSVNMNQTENVTNSYSDEKKSDQNFKTQICFR